MRIPFVIFIIGLIILFVGIVVVPATVLTWQPRSAKIEGFVVHVYFPYLMREYNVGEAKDLMLSGVASELSGRKFNFYILASASYNSWWSDKAYTTYFEKKNITSTSFSIPLTTEQATILVIFMVKNPRLDVNDYVNVKVSATLEWHEFTGELILGGKIAFLGIILITIAGVATFKPKAPTPSRSFVVFVSLYFFVLLVSYWLGAFYPSFTFYGWFVIPVVANFFVGYLVREVGMATKIIIASFILQAGIVLVLLYTPLVNAFLAWLELITRYGSTDKSTVEAFVRDPFGWTVIVIVGYTLINIILGIVVSLVGKVVRKDVSDIITVCRDFIKLLLERSIKVKFLFVMSILFLMGMSSTWVSSYFYRVEGGTILYHDYVFVDIISCGFPLPYLYLTNPSFITPWWLGIQPYNPTNFLLDTLFYVSIYSIITAFGYTITHGEKVKEIIRLLFRPSDKQNNVHKENL